MHELAESELSEVVWQGRPSLRQFLPPLVAWLAVGAWLYLKSFVLIQAFVNRTVFLNWTQVEVTRLFYGFQIAVFLPVAFTLLRMFRRRVIHYTMTRDRLLIRRGIVVRTLDQIWLRRVRDFRVMEPLGARITGTGTLLVISRDDTLPRLVMGPFRNPEEVEALMRPLVMAAQQASNYREIEAI